MHVEQLKSGSWRVAVKYRGRRATGTAATKSDAQQLGARLLIRLGGTPGQRGDVTVEQLVETWFSVAKLSATYRADARSCVDRHLPATFAARTLDQVTPAVVDALYADLLAAGVSSHRVRRLHAVLSSAWTLALRYQWANGVSPFENVEKPTEPMSDVRPPTDDEFDALIANTPDSLLLYLEVAETLGARRGELVGLQWADIDLTAGASAVKVRRALSFAGGQHAVTEGKSGRKGHRTIGIDDALSARLRGLRLHQVEISLREGLPGPVWVFSHDAGVSPWRPEWPTKQFAKIRAAAGVPAEVKLHGFRHAMATRLLADGVPMKTVSERMGHTKVATTTDRYGAFVPAADRAAAAVVARFKRTGRG